MTFNCLEQQRGKSNKCKVCDFASDYVSALKVHLKTHIGKSWMNATLRHRCYGISSLDFIRGDMWMFWWMKREGIAYSRK